MHERECESCDTPTPRRVAEDRDPWKHHSMLMKCKTCMWYAAKPTDRIVTAADRVELGRCRRHAPTMNGFPVVTANDWCGDHKLDENKN